MDFKISTPIAAICALAAYIAIQLVYEIPSSGWIYLFFEAESIAIFIVNLLSFIGLMLAESYPGMDVWIGLISLLHALCFIGMSTALIVSCSGETIEGLESAVFGDSYRIKVLIGSSFGVITSIVLFVQFILSLMSKAFAAL